ncbi:MAG TPA: cation-transporting P-type ATPase, partial [Aquaticitalea sp.]|nr:cation-transporting P-type ATPase [Aquaticitalea sp.]
MISLKHLNIQGLSDTEVRQSRQTFGMNRMVYKKENALLKAIKNVLKEPMVIILLVAVTIY